jgi:predicted aldo/keto reductase-like oxidoreductase
MLKKRRLGRTEIVVPLVGFGGIPIMRVSTEEAVDVIGEALRQGIDFFDTARGYGDSERKIGEALRTHGARPVLASKSPMRERGSMLEDFEQSLSDLGAEAVDLYQAHCVNTPEDYGKIMAKGGAYEALAELRSQGRLRFIGLTSHNLSIAKEAVESSLFDTVQVLFSLLEPEAADEVIPMALEKDVGVLGMKPFGGGCIDRYDIALRYVISNPGVIAIPGMATVEEVRKNVAVASEPRPLSSEELRAAEAAKEEIGTRYCRRCDYCQPCPNEIPIAFMLHIPSIRKRIGDSMMNTDTYRDLLRKGSGCDDCGQCEERCPFNLPVRDLIRESRQVLAEVLE